MNELVKWDEIENQIDIERDINVLVKYHAVLGNKEFRKQLDGSIRGVNKCEKYKIKVEMAFGDYYKKLEKQDGGRPVNNSLSQLTSSQQAEEDIGKSRVTISKYTEISDIKNREEVLEKFESECNNKGLEMSSVGFLNFAKNKPHVSNNSGENEWYTPEYIIETARNTMGSIDLDPATSLKANEIVKAEEIFTKEDDGLIRKWSGNIWMNPPYSQGLMSEFSDKLISELSNINQACVLVNNATETNWFQNLLTECNYVCFLKGRVKYLDYTGTMANSPLQGQAILYFGGNREEFFNNFYDLGICLTRKS